MKLFVFYKLPLLFVVLFFFLQATPSVKANETLFFDEFNGNANLEIYNNNYKPISNFNPTGKFYVSNGYIKTIGYDPGYVYKGIDNLNKCASIDFSWSEGGSWTGIFFGGDEISWKDQIQLRIDDNITNWVYYKNIYTLEDSGKIFFNPNSINTLKICITETSINAYLNNTNFLKRSNTPQSNGYFGIAAQEGVKFIDNFKITAFNPQIILDIPEIKQTNKQWGNEIYDSADKWNPNDPSIGAWGCSLTSATMVFKYYGINQLPNRLPTNPSTLNQWLKYQKDGYIGNGNLNWLSLSRLSRESLKINKISKFEALEFKKNYKSDLNYIYLNLKNKIPDIIEIPGHFVVSKGISENNDIIINDPFYDKNILSDQTNIQAINTYYPSNTDLSYIMIVFDTNSNIKLLNKLGKEVGETYLQNMITNPISLSKNNPAIKILYLNKPEEGIYNIKIDTSKNKNYDIDVFTYDKKGQVLIRKEKGVSFNDEITIPINYKNKSNLYKRKVSINSMIIDTEKAALKKQFKDKSLKTNLIFYLQIASIYNKTGSIDKKIKNYKEIEDLLISNKHLINQEAYEILLYDLNYLTSNI